MTTYRLSSPRMTVLVKTNDRGEIVDAAPVVRRFVGQRLQALWAWLVKLDGERNVTIDRLDEEGDG